MRRRFFTCAIILLCTAKVLIVSLWAASLFRYDLIAYRTRGSGVVATAVSSDGGLGVTITWRLGGAAMPQSEAVAGVHWSALPHVGRGGLGLDPLHRVPNVLGIGGGSGDFSAAAGPSRRLVVVAPHWALLLVLAIPSLLLARRTLQEHIATTRRRRGLCLSCAYDLRGLVAVEQCPECGEPVSSAPPTATPGSTAPATAASAR